MAIAKVVEVNSSSIKSFEDAIQSGIAKVTETIKNVQGAWINEQKVIIKDNKIVEYRVNLKISFLKTFLNILSVYFRPKASKRSPGRTSGTI